MTPKKREEGTRERSPVSFSLFLVPDDLLIDLLITMGSQSTGSTGKDTVAMLPGLG